MASKFLRIKVLTHIFHISQFLTNSDTRLSYSPKFDGKARLDLSCGHLNTRNINLTCLKTGLLVRLLDHSTPESNRNDLKTMVTSIPFTRCLCYKSERFINSCERLLLGTLILPPVTLITIPVQVFGSPLKNVLMKMSFICRIKVIIPSVTSL